jgi:hypothetical protein
MNPESEEIKRLLLENLQLSRENNKLLRKLRRAEVTRTIMTLVYWAVILVVPIYIYYAYLAPQLSQMLATYENIEAQTQEMPEGVRSYIDSLREFVPAP